MFNKIYIKLKSFIRENIVYLCILAFIIFISRYPVNYYIITGGGTFDSEKRVEVSSKYKQKGKINFCYVAELKGTILTYLISYIVPSFERESVDLYKTNKNESIEDIEFRNKLLLDETNNTALFVAFNKASKKIEVEKKNTYIYYITEKAKTNLKIGDTILEVDNKKIDDFKDLRKIVNTKNVGDKVSIKVLEHDKEKDKYAYVYEENNKLYLGITIIEDVIYKTNPEVKFKFKDSESGPSGGLILTLQIYNMITKKDITKGYNIAGTGTIDKEGNIGEIDGIKYKLKGAVKNKSDIFLVPAGNYKEAVKEKKKNRYKIKIIKVKTFDDVIMKLSKE